MSELSDYIEAKVGTTEQAEPVGVQRERERQAALKQRGESIKSWRAYVNQQEPATRVDGRQLSELVAVAGGVGFVSEVLGVRPYDVEQSIRHSATTPLTDAVIRKFITATQSALREQRRK